MFATFKLWKTCKKAGSKHWCVVATKQCAETCPKKHKNLEGKIWPKLGSENTWALKTKTKKLIKKTNKYCTKFWAWWLWACTGGLTALECKSDCVSTYIPDTVPTPNCLAADCREMSPIARRATRRSQFSLMSVRSSTFTHNTRKTQSLTDVTSFRWC